MSEVTVFCLRGILWACVWDCNKETVKCNTSLYKKVTGETQSNAPQQQFVLLLSSSSPAGGIHPGRWRGRAPRGPQATLHPGTRIPNRALLSLSPAAPPLTMLSHLPDLLWLPSVIMTVERPTQRWSRGSLSLERGRIMGNLGVIDLAILTPLLDLISYHDLQRATVFVFKAQIALISGQLFLELHVLFFIN